jgi:phosphohistidine phosphatase
MKTLTLLRHAKSAWDDAVARDIDRPLNGRGRRAAVAVGQEMRAMKLRFDVIVASPARRVIETLEELETGYGEKLSPAFDKRIYLASSAQLLELVRETDDDAASLMLVGHSPGLESLALDLTSATDGRLRDLIEEKYPTAALTEISLPIDRWRDARDGIGKVEHFVRPRDLDPALGPGK